MSKLTEKQAEVFYFIRENVRAYNRPPSTNEMCAKFQINNNAVFERVRALIKKGAIEKRVGHRAYYPVKGYRVSIKKEPH